MEHAVRFHIREHLDEDPVYYEKLSKRVDEILDRLKERWEQIALEFQELVDEVKAGRTDENNTGLDPATELPFHNLMAEQGRQLRARHGRPTDQAHQRASGRDPPA